LRSRKVQTKQADEVAPAVIEALEDLPISWVKTITFDNGTEFTRNEEMAKTTAALAMGAEFTIDGQAIKDLGATSRDRLVKGICAKWEGEMLIAKAKHRRLNEQIDELQSKRISKQSIFKHLDVA
ncbi:hypothetical protein LCGC14_2652060, partial [marine sediment metagenome]